MPNSEKLPFLLQLLDDDSPVVQKALAEELASFGSELPVALASLPFGLASEQKEILFNLLGNYHRDKLRENWKAWLSVPDEDRKIETAYSYLTDFQNGPFHKVNLSAELDRWTNEYRADNSCHDPYRLAHFLFRQKGLRGASEDSYHDAANSNLAHVLETGRGLPISLAAIYKLTAERLGLSVTGCAYPGHFLARTTLAGKSYLVDCFHGGRFMEEDVFWEEQDSSQEIALREEVSAGMWMKRVARNLLESFTRAGCEQDADLMRELLETEDNG